MPVKTTARRQITKWEPPSELVYLRQGEVSFRVWCESEAQRLGGEVRERMSATNEKVIAVWA
jgi:hypothetical protein